jgi:hypothetical protein
MGSPPVLPITASLSLVYLPHPVYSRLQAVIEKLRRRMD